MLTYCYFTYFVDARTLNSKELILKVENFPKQNKASRTKILVKIYNEDSVRKTRTRESSTLGS